MFQEFTVTIPVFPGNEFDIHSFGAVPGGKTSNTAAFAAAFEVASIKTTGEESWDFNPGRNRLLFRHTG